MALFSTNDTPQVQQFTLVGSDPAQSISTVSGTETTLKTYAIPAGHGLTTGSKIIIGGMWSMTNNANNKTLKVKIGATSFYSSAVASSASVFRETVIWLRSLSSQIVFATTNNTGVGTTTGTFTTATEDVSGAITITITATCATATDVVNLEASSVRFEIL